MNWTNNGGLNAVTLKALGFGVQGPLAISGVQATYIGTADSIPQVVTLTNSAPSPVLLNYGPALGYTPSDSTKWANPQPTTVQQALDRIAAVVGGVTPIP